MSRTMSLDASDLPLGASQGPMVLASTVRATVDAAVAAGLERRALLARIDLTEADLEDPDRPVPLEAQTAAWEAIAEHPRAETLSLELARSFKADHLGVFGWVIANAPTGRDMVASMRRYRAFFGDPYTPEVDEVPNGVVIHRVFEPRIARTRVMPEFAPASTITLLRELLGLDASTALARDVWFQHAPPRDPSLHEAYFGCAVRFSAPETRLVLAADVLDRTPPNRNPNLHSYLERHALALTATMAERTTVGERVRMLVAEMLRNGEPSQHEVARKLGMSERTLQRRLKEEDRTFAEVLDGVRRELSVRYLGDADLTIYEVAFLLGYAEPSSFHRAFRRWTGESPQELRTRLRAHGS